MKLWKYSFITAATFLCVSFAVLYTSCTRDSCQTFTCRNEGVCTDGFCRCLDGYEGTQCEITSSQKFIGTYDGITKVNNEPVIIDSAYVTHFGQDTTRQRVIVRIASRGGKTFTGRAILNEVLPENLPAGKDVTMEYIGENKIEILIDETVDGVRTITNFQGTKRQ